MKIRITKRNSWNENPVYLYGNKVFTDKIESARTFQTVDEAASHIKMWGIALVGDDEKVNIEIDFSEKG